MKRENYETNPYSPLSEIRSVWGQTRLRGPIYKILRKKIRRWDPRIAPRRPNDYLYLSEGFHKTCLTLDEKGTEAVNVPRSHYQGKQGPIRFSRNSNCEFV